jgi:hypothetical protein
MLVWKVKVTLSRLSRRTSQLVQRVHPNVIAPLIQVFEEDNILSLSLMTCPEKPSTRHKTPV